MRSSRHSLLSRLRPWVAPMAGIFLSVGLSVLPLAFKAGLAGVLERTVFYPYRFALGWGPRSLTAQSKAVALAREQAGRALEGDETREAERENDRLRGLLGFHRRADVDLVPAVVVGRGRARFGDLLVVEPAERGGAAVGQVAISPEGLIGRVASTEGGLARVECLTNLNVAVSVVNQRSREGGILRWGLSRGSLVIDGVPSQADWRPGDRVITSGLGTAFPRGILVGWVGGHRSGRGGLQSVLVRAAASPGRAQEVFLLHFVAGSSDMAGASVPGLTSLYPTESPRSLRGGPAAITAATAAPAPAP